MTQLATERDALRKPPIASSRRRGRGAVSNEVSRFETQKRSEIDDGWDSLGALPRFTTEIAEEMARGLITRNQSPDISFDRSINPYRGCEHGCTYCFARPTHAYLGLSPGLDFETKLVAKSNAAEVLERELASPRYEARTIALGTATDPYQPIERERKLTRSVLEVLDRFSHPVGIVTKSALVTRDIDILARMAERNLAKVAMSVTTLDHRRARSLEPRASTPARRLEAIRKLTEAGIPTTVLVAPIIPALNDYEIEAILEKAYEAGAREAGWVMLRLPREVRDVFTEWLMTHEPDRYRHVMSIVRAMRGGKDYDATFGKRQTGEGPYAWMIARRFQAALRRLGYRSTRTRLDCGQFRRPLASAGQLSLF